MYIYIYIYTHGAPHLAPIVAPNLPKIVPAKIRCFRTSGKTPMDMNIPRACPLNIPVWLPPVCRRLFVVRPSFLY